MRYTFPTPFAFEVVGLELVLFADEADVASVTLTMVSGTTTETISVDALGAAVRARNESNARVVVASGASPVFQLSVTAVGTPWTLTRCYAVVHIRTDRGATSAPSGATGIGQGTAVSRAPLNTLFTALSAVTSSDAALTTCGRISVHTYRAPAMGLVPLGSGSARLPMSEQRIVQASSGIVATAGNNWTATLTRQSGTPVWAATLVGGGAALVTATSAITDAGT
jgi:hypothetical protein